MWTYGDVVRYRTPMQEVTLLSHPDAVRTVLSSDDFVRLQFTKNVLGSGVLSSDGPLWERRRKLMLPEFSRDRVRGMVATFRSITEARMDTWADAPDATRDISREMDHLTLLNIGRALFGFAPSEAFLGTSAQVAPGQEQQATTYIHRFRLTEDEDILQPLQPHGDRTPIFLVHGLTGNAAGPYRNVVAHLDDDQPVFGIRQPKNAGESIEELAALYIDAIRAVQRKGPFHIGGYCFGGMIAYEVARQLEQSGQATEQLTLFDPPPPRLLEKLALPARLGGWTRHIARSTTFLASQMIGGRPSAFRHAADATARALRKLKARIVPERHTRIDAATATHATHVQATVRCNLELLSKYYPGSYGGAVTLVLSSEPSSYRALAPEKWAQLNEAVHTAWVSTYHDDMLNSAGTKHVTTFLKRTSSTSPTARRRSG